MTLSEVYNILKIAGQAQPNINTIEDDFLKLNREDTVYSAFIIQQREHQRVGDFINYSFYIGYVDRLTDDKSNEVDIHSTGINVLNSIVNGIKESCYPTIDIAAGRYITFNQRFTAECAGVYTDVILSVPASDCPDFEFHFGGGDLRPAVFKSNGVYEPVGFDGYSKVTVEVEGGGVSEEWVKNYTYSKSETDSKITVVRGEIPTRVSQLTNDAGYLTEHQTLKTINGESVVGEGNIEIKCEECCTPDMLKVFPYFYKMDLTNLDYEYAKTHIGDPIYGGCSVVNRGNRIGRNYDWKYDNKAEFLVKTPAMYGRYAVMGMCGGMNKLTEMFVDTLAYTDDYRLLPFNMLDGINSEGLYCSMNVVPATGGMATEGDICNTMLVRYILDHCSTVVDTHVELQDKVIYNHPQMAAAGYEVQIYVANKDAAAVFSWKDGEMIVTPANQLTNFHIAGVNFNPDGTVNTPEMACYGVAAPRDNNIEGFESGLERWNLIVNSRDTNLEDLMEALFYTNAYKNQPGIWFSEFVGGDFDVNVGDFQVLNNHFIEAKAEYERRDRETGTTWQTVHSCIYDLDYLTVTVTVQEDTDYARTFSFNDRYTNDEIDEKFATKSDIPTIPENVSAFNNDAGYLTEHQDISNLATKAELDEYRKRDTSTKIGDKIYSGIYYDTAINYITTNDAEGVIEGSLYIGQDGFNAISGDKANRVSWIDVASKDEIPSLDGYATQTWVEGKGYLTEVPSDYAKKTDIPTIPENVSAFNNDAGYLTQHQDISNLATKSELSQVAGQIPSLDGYATESWVEEQGYLTEHQDISNLATKGEVKAVEDKIPSLTGYATEEFVTSQGYLTEVPDEYAKKTDIPDVSNFATKDEIPTVPKNVSAFNNDAGYLTEHQDISGLATKAEVEAVEDKIPSLTGYATQSWVEGKGYLTQHQDISNLATKNELSVVEGKIPSLTGYATQTWVEGKGYTTNKGTVTSVAVKMNGSVKGTITSSGTIDLGTVITSHQDISGKVDKSSIWTGTQAQWDALTAAQKASYTIALVIE